MENGAHKIAREKCSGCGECQKACPQRALKLAGNTSWKRPISLKIVLEDKAFYDTSGGGVTPGRRGAACPAGCGP